jgi:putative restriction endonuclease
MNGFTATTDYGWYAYLCTRPDFDEVNFWAPSGRASLGTVHYGSPFFFKLKSPHNAIGGFGFLGPITTVPLSLAWEAFGQKNGAPDLPTMAARIRRYRRETAGEKNSFDPPVGCRTILQPTFFPPEAWVPAPSDWSPNIVQGKTYDLTRDEGLRMWLACQAQASARQATIIGDQPGLAAEPAERYGREVTYCPRLGQGAFRLAVTDAYGRACAVTGEHSLPVLDSAHIQPYAEGGAHEVSNGLLLRADLHRLYDRGYVTVTPDFEFRVSSALREEYENGRIYYDLEKSLRDGGRVIRLPGDPGHRPDRDRLAWHRDAIFKG